MNSKEINSLVVDVRNVTPRERHPMIFRALDTLVPGQALQLINDHDPMPLNFQLQATRPNQFSWEYREAGPEVWAVEITRLPIASR